MTFENTGNFNGIFYGKNVDFTGAFPPTETMKVNGKLLIANDGVDLGPQIRVGTITSPSGTLAIGYSAPNITMDLVGGFADLHTAKWIVNKVAGQGGNQLSIAAALAAAAAGDTIFVMPGTYTENLSLVAGVNIVAFTGDESTPNVTIVGKLTMTTAGTCTISNIRLQTNSDFLLQVSGSAASVVNLENCYLNCLNNTGISFTSSSASSQINFSYCNGNVGTTGISLYSMSSPGLFLIKYSNFGNSGSSQTPSSNSAGSVFFVWSSSFSPVSTTSAGTVQFQYTDINTSVQNVTCFTTAGTGSSNAFSSKFSAGSASCISIGVNTVFACIGCYINSSATNTITGAGTLFYSMNAYAGSSTLINPTTQVIQAGTAFQSINIQTFTSSGTYTPTAGMKFCQIEVVGGGGGGGGTAATAAATAAAAGGGGGGGYSKGIFTISTIGVSQAVTIANAAAGGIGNSVGANGGTCSVGALINAIGGTGGQGSGAAPSFVLSGGQGGIAGSGGSLNATGGPGSSGVFSVAGGIVQGSAGGNSIYGGGGLAQGGPGISSVFNGVAGTNYGGGGAGSGAGTNSGAGSAAGTGGAGAKGIVIITEYI